MQKGHQSWIFVN